MIVEPDDVTKVVMIWANRDLMKKLFGPTAEYLGDGMKGLVQKGSSNVGKIISAAIERLGDKINERGVVPPRILKDIVLEGAFIEDELTIRYLVEYSLRPERPMGAMIAEVRCLA